MRWLSTVKGFEGGRLVVERMELDGSGRTRPTGELETIEADALVLAIGQNADLSVLEKTGGVRVSDRVVEVDENMMTGHPGLFAGATWWPPSAPSRWPSVTGRGPPVISTRTSEAWPVSLRPPARSRLTTS